VVVIFFDILSCVSLDDDDDDVELQGGTCVLLEHLAADPSCDGYCRVKETERRSRDDRFFNDEYLQR
jgi:hypothetical protein